MTIIKSYYLAADEIAIFFGRVEYVTNPFVGFENFWIFKVFFSTVFKQLHTLEVGRIKV